MIDGGVFANNPAMCALAAAYRMFRNSKPKGYMVVSLGTGGLQRPIPYNDAKDWGLLGWARPLLSVFFDSSSDTVCYQVSEALGKNHYRFDIQLGADPNDPAAANDDFDDASPENIARLQAKAQQLIQDRSAMINDLAAILGNKKSRIPISNP